MKIKELLEHLGFDNLNEFRPAPNSHVVLVTGKMAKPGLERMMQAIDPDDFTYEIRAMNIQVAAWLTMTQVAEGIGDLTNVDLILLPGKTMGDEKELEKTLKVKVMRGPNCYSEMPEFLEEKGFEQQVSDVPRPKILVLGQDTETLANFLSKTYEVPLITIDSLIKRAMEDGIEVDDWSRHNVIAELVRARLLEADAQKGFVIHNYPRIERDVNWLEEMAVTLDAVVHYGDYDLAVINHYKKEPGFIEPKGKTEQDILANSLEQVESLMQQCIKPNQGMAINKNT